MKHGYFGTPTYKSWADAKARCTNVRRIDYQFYGGRGIAMHGPWSDNFSPEVRAGDSRAEQILNAITAAASEVSRK